MPIRAVITGATGMVGEGVLHECLQSSEVEAVLVVGRRPCGVSHSKLKEVIVKDFFDLAPIEADLKGYNACFFCLGVSSMGKTEAEYRRLTYDLTLGFARALQKHNPDLTFCYVSGQGTDSTERGKIMWARVKGKTENDLLKLFPKAYMFRPGYMQPTPGLKNANKAYAYISWMYPVLRKLFPNSVSTLKEVSTAMLSSVIVDPNIMVLELKDILGNSSR